MKTQQHEFKNEIRLEKLKDWKVKNVPSFAYKYSGQPNFLEPLNLFNKYNSPSILNDEHSVPNIYWAIDFNSWPFIQTFREICLWKLDVCLFWWMHFFSLSSRYWSDVNIWDDYNIQRMLYKEWANSWKAFLFLGLSMYWLFKLKKALVNNT